MSPHWRPGSRVARLRASRSFGFVLLLVFVLFLTMAALPDESWVAEQLTEVDTPLIHAVREAMRLQLAQALRTIGAELMKTERYAKNGIGWMDDKKMCGSVDLVNTYMGVARKVECKEVYTNEFLTMVELPKSMR